MAPQQNSTLIEENLDSCPSLTNIPDEIVSYSPILPPKNKHNYDISHINKKTNNNNNVNNANYLAEPCHFRKCNYATREFQQQCRNLPKNKHTYRNGSIRSGHSRKSRSISLYGVNSTMEQGFKEITIWLGDEPRYVSGVTNKTTCNDIIKALIDDEISNGNYEYCQHTKDGTASRDYADYVITECWRGIERSYDGLMPILPVWKAWSRVQNEIRLSLKHHKDIQDPIKALKPNNTLTSIRKYICKLLHFGKTKKPKSNPQVSNNANTKKFNNKKQNIQDTKPSLKSDGKYVQNKLDGKISKECCKNRIESKPETDKINHPGIQQKRINNKEKLYKLSETRSSIRKRRSVRRRKDKKSKASDNGKDVPADNNYLRRRKDSGIRSSVRQKLAEKNAEMNQLYEREYALTKALTSKCKLYKLQNELYKDADTNLEMSVNRVQQKIEEYAKDIIRTEHELLEVKNEIKQDISIINNLKRLSIDSDSNYCAVKNVLENALISNVATPALPDCNKSICLEQMQFVDNIYEFCDNNASMLV